MSFNTIHLNQDHQLLNQQQEIWIFGYGSLIYKVDFPFIEKAPASIFGWQRRFWQGSHDHRGTPNNPGRVVTLIQSHGDECAGIAYKVTRDVFDHLNYREKNGYFLVEVDIYFDNDLSKRIEPDIAVKGLVYIALKDNDAFLGHAPNEHIAKQIYYSSGPSGLNKDYVYQLAQALRNMGKTDEHVFEIDTLLREFNSQSE